MPDLESGNMSRDCHDRWDMALGPWVMIRWALSGFVFVYQAQDQTNLIESVFNFFIQELLKVES